VARSKAAASCPSPAKSRRGSPANDDDARGRKLQLLDQHRFTICPMDAAKAARFSASDTSPFKG
jgi:hypothetical protein